MDEQDEGYVKLKQENAVLQLENERLKKLCKEAQRALLNGGGYSTQLMHDLNNA